MSARGTYKRSGIPIRTDMPTRNNAWYVCSVTYAGDDAPNDASGYGESPWKPFATIDYAVGKCTANDEIHVLEGHAETLTDTNLITMDVAGVSLIGHGRWTNKPTLTMSATASGINTSAKNLVIHNIRFVSSVNSLLNFIEAAEGELIVEDCDFVTGSATEAVCFIDLGGATTFDNFIIRNCTFLQPSDPEGTGAAVNTGGVYIVDSENILIENCKFRGQFETGIVHNKTTACKGLVIKNCELSNELTVPLLLVTTAEGVADGCYGATLVAADASEAEIWGTIGTIFWISNNTSLGNDSGGGGQLAVPGTAACS